MFIVYRETKSGIKFVAEAIDYAMALRHRGEARRRFRGNRVIIKREDKMTNSELERILVFKAKWNNKVAIHNMLSRRSGRAYKDSKEQIVETAHDLVVMRDEHPRGLAKDDQVRMANFQALDF